MGSVFDTVGDIFGDIVEFAVDDIIEPVFEFVGDIVEGMADDPLGTLLTIATIVVPGPWTAYAWVARAALTAAQGGSLKDIAISAASSYLGTKAGTWASSATTAAIGTGVGATVTERLVARAAEGAARGIVGATISSAASGDFDAEEIAMAGFMGAAQSAGSAAFSEFTSTGDFSLEEVENSAEYADYIATVDAVDSGVADLAAGFRDLPEIAQEIIKNTAAASVTVAMSGGDVDLVDVLGPAIAKAATSVYLTEDIIKELYSEDTPYVTQSVGYLINAVNSSIDAAFAETSIVEAFNSSVAQDQYSDADLSKIVDYITSDKVLNLFSKEREASDAYTEAVRDAAIIADEEDDLEAEYLDINNEKDLVNAELAKVKALQAGKDATNPFTRGQIEADIARSKSLFDARVITHPSKYELRDHGESEWEYEWVDYPDTINTANDAEIVSLNKRVGDWITKNNSLIATYDTARVKFNSNKAAYDTSVQAYNNNISAYTAKLDAARDALTVAADNTFSVVEEPLSTLTNNAIVQNINPDFNAKEYAELHGVPSEAIGDDPDEVDIAWKDGSNNSSAASHYLNNKENAVNYEENNQQVKAAILRSIPEPVLQQLKSIADFENIDAYKSAGSKEAKAKVRAAYVEKAYNDYAGGVRDNIDPSLKTTTFELTPKVITASGKTVFDSIQTDYDPTDTSLEEPYESKVLEDENLSSSQIAEQKAAGQLKYHSVYTYLDEDGNIVVETDIWAKPQLDTTEAISGESPVSYSLGTGVGIGEEVFETTVETAKKGVALVEKTKETFAAAAKVFSEIIPSDIEGIFGKSVENFAAKFGINRASFDFLIGKDVGDRDPETGLYPSQIRSDAENVDAVARTVAAIAARVPGDRPTGITEDGNFQFVDEDGKVYEEDWANYVAALDIDYDTGQGRGSELFSMTNDFVSGHTAEVSEWEKLQQAEAKRKEEEDFRARGIALGYRRSDDPWTDAARAEGLSLAELRILDPKLYLYELDRVGKDASTEFMEGLDPLDRNLIKMATALSDASKNNTGTYDNPIKNERDLTEHTLLADTLAALISGGTEQVTAAVGLFNAFQNAKTKGTGDFDNPYTAIGQPVDMTATLQALNNIGEATQSKELREGMLGLQAARKKGPGEVAKYLAENPYVFTMGMVLPELFSEIVPLATSLATGGVGGAIIARAAGRAATKNIIKGQTAFKKKISGQTAFATATATASLETFGGTYDEAFNKVRRAALKAGQSESQATQTAHTEASRIAIKAAMTELVTAGVDPTARLSQKILNKGSGASAKSILGAAKKTAGMATLEAGSEAVEESNALYDIAQAVIKLTPEAGEVGGEYYNLGSMMGVVGLEAALIAGPVSIVFDIAGDLITDESIGSDGSGADIGDGGGSFSFDLNYSGLDDADILTTFSPTISKAVSEAGSKDPVVSAAAKDTLEGLFDYNVLSDTKNYTDLEFSTDADGAYFYNIATEVLNKVAPDEYNTSEEVGGYFPEIGARLGVVYDPSDSDIRQLTGPSTLIDTTEAITNIISENAFTRPEALAAVPGYNFGANEVIPGLGVGTPEEQAAAVTYLQDEYVPPRQFTEENLEAALGSDLFSTLTLEQKVNLTGQGDEGYNLAQIEVAKDYRNEREVTSEEATAAIEAEGYTKPNDPDGAAAYDAEVAKYVGVSNDPTHQDTIFGNITSDIDPRYIKESEARQAYLNLGITNPAQSDVDRFIGLGDETQLAANIDSYLPAATYNLARDPQGGDDGLEDIIDAKLAENAENTNTRFNEAKTANETANKALQELITTEFTAQFEGTEAQFTALKAELTQNVANTDAQFKAAADERAEAAESLKSYEGRIVSLGSLITQNAENTDNKLNDARTASEEADAALQNLVNSNFQGTTEQYNNLYNQAIADKEAATAQFNIATDERATNAANALNYQNKFDTRLTGIGDRVTSGFADSDKKFNDARTASEEADTALQNLVNSNFQGTTEQYNDLYNQATANKEATTTQFNTAADERATAASDFDTFQNQTGGRFNEIAAAQGDISDRIGVRGREVTQSDLDSYSGIIDQQGQSNAPALTSEQTIYDVNNDGFVDITDQEILQQIFAGTLSSSTLSNTNPFASTGLQGQLIDQSVATRNTATQTAANTAAARQTAQEAARQAAQQAANTAAEAQQAAQQAAAQQAAQQAAAQQQTQTQIATAIANQQAADNQRRQEAAQQQLMAALQQTRPITVEAEPGGELEAPIDPFGRNILVNAEQENLFNNLLGVEPLAAAKGGLIMDPTDEILRILGGR